MGTVALPVFRSLVAGLSRDQLRSFVADVWRARGFEVTVEDDLVYVYATDDVTREDSGENVARDDPVETLYPVPARLGERFRSAGTQAPPAATAVVAGGRVPSWAADHEDLTVVDTEALYNLVLYGLDRARTRELFREYFDRSPEEVARMRPGSRRGATVIRTLPASLRPFATSVSERLSADLVRTTAVLVVVVLVVLAVVLAAGVPGLFGGTQPLRAGVTTPTVGQGTPFPTPTATVTPPADPSPFPPGVNESGIVDRDSLLAAHLTNVTDRTYRLLVSYREVGANHTGYAQEVVSRGAKTRYVVEHFQGGTLTTDPWVIAGMESYANGETRYERHVHGSNVTYRTQQVYDGRVGIIERRGVADIDRALSAENSTVVASFTRGTTTFYRLSFDGDTRNRFENLNGTALVDEAGVVHYVRIGYTHPETGVDVTVTIWYDNFGATSVTQPDWLSAAQGSDGNQSVAG